MQRLIVCLGLVLFLSNSVKSQISDVISEDSVKSLLCHKWGYRAVIMSGQELTNFDESLTYQFYKDNTLQRVSSKGKSEKGNWTYDSNDKLITIKIKKVILFVIKLKPGDLVISPYKTGDKDNSLGMAIALKVIEE